MNRADRTARPARPELANWLRSTNNVTQQFMSIGGRTDFVSLAGGLPAAELFPVDAVRDAAERALARWGSRALDYGPVEGFPALREAIAHRMSTSAGRTFGVENVLVTTGAMQGLELLGKVFLDRGDLAVVQFPTYLGALDAWRPREATYEKLTWELERPGFDEALRRTKFVYAVPNYSNPTGALVAQADRLRLLEKVMAAATWLIEDDPYLPLQLDGRPGPSMLALHAAMTSSGAYEGPVIYLSTLSKSVVPGLRVGWVVAEASLVQALTVAKQSADLSGSMFTHAVALEFIESGFEALHVPKLLQVYRERRDALLGAASEHLSQWFEWESPPGGMFVWMRARPSVDAPPVDTSKLYSFALEEKVAFVPSSVFDFEGKLTTAMRLNFTRSSPEVIVEGVHRLRRAVERYQASNSKRAHGRVAG